MAKFNELEKLEIEEMLRNSKKKSDFQRIQCVWLRAEFSMSADIVAKITGLKTGTVRKIWSEYNREGKQSLLVKDRGGRRNYHLSPDEEKIFLSPFFKKAEKDKFLIVAEVKAAYEKMVEKDVPKSTIYRLLSRHGWKKQSGKMLKENNDNGKHVDMHEYWIEGCAQALQPERRGNISQQWLNSTLQSMVIDKNEK